MDNLVIFLLMTSDHLKYLPLVLMASRIADQTLSCFYELTCYFATMASLSSWAIVLSKDPLADLVVGTNTFSITFCLVNSILEHARAHLTGVYPSMSLMRHTPLCSFD